MRIQRRMHLRILALQVVKERRISRIPFVETVYLLDPSQQPIDIEY